MKRVLFSLVIMGILAYPLATFGANASKPTFSSVSAEKAVDSVVTMHVVTRPVLSPQPSLVVASAPQFCSFASSHSQTFLQDQPQLDLRVARDCFTLSLGSLVNTQNLSVRTLDQSTVRVVVSPSSSTPVHYDTSQNTLPTPQPYMPQPLQLGFLTGAAVVLVARRQKKVQKLVQRFYPLQFAQLQVMRC
jgi:hypothetical protein